MRIDSTGKNFGRRHGHTYGPDGRPTRTYRAWVNMRSRVAGVTDSYRRNYSDRGITICERWKSFENFLADMGECPVGLSLERENNDSNYCPENCVWANRRKQNSNKRTTLRVIFNGKSMCLAHACEISGILYDTAIKRITKQGMTAQQAIDVKA